MRRFERYGEYPVSQIADFAGVELIAIKKVFDALKGKPIYGHPQKWNRNGEMVNGYVYYGYTVGIARAVKKSIIDYSIMLESEREENAVW